jgi:putative ABC transport system substrate-binding protein
MKYILLVLSAILFSACGEDNVTNNYIGYDRTFVLITDYDRSSELVMSLSGIVNKEFPNVKFDYIQTRNFDVAQAAYVIEQAKKNYPINTVFLSTVDDGDMERNIIFKVGEQAFILPDNGLASRVLTNYTHGEIRYIDNMLLFDGKHKSIDDVTFFEIYNSALRTVLSGAQLNRFGSICSEPRLRPVYDAYRNAGVVIGQSLYIDNIGNIETNISSDLLAGIELGSIIKVQAGGSTFYARWSTNFSSVPFGANVALLDADNKLILAVNFGNMSAKYNLNAGDTIQISAANIKVGILRYNMSEISGNIVLGTKNRMQQYGLIEGKNVEYFEKNANGDASRLASLCKELVDLKCDIIIPVSTSASKAAVDYVPANIPVVFTYVTSPEFAGILNVRENVTGLSDATNFDDYLKFVKELFPDLTHAGRMYNPSEPNSLYAQQRLNSLSVLYGLELTSEIVENISQITPTLSYFESQQINTILIAADNTMNLGMKDLSQNAIVKNMFVVGDSRENVEDGAIGGVSVNYDELAIETGISAISVLLGINADAIAVKYLPTTQIYLNKKTAQALNFTFSNDLLMKASYIVE